MHQVAINPGCADISAVAFCRGSNKEITPCAFSRVKSSGFCNGMVVEMKEATDAISALLGNIKDKIGANFQHVYSTISSSTIKVVPSEGTLVLSKYGREIFERDIKKCVDTASTIKVPLDRAVLHSFVKGFALDGEENISNPVSLDGVKLSAKVNVITVDSTVVKNLSKCISQAGYVPAGFVLSGLAASFRAMDEQDKKDGSALVNVSAGAVETVVFGDGQLNDCRIFPVGTDDFVIEPGRIEKDILQDVVDKMRTMEGWKKVKKAVIIGNAILSDNFIESVEPFFDIPVAAGICLPRPFENLPPDMTGYIGGLGLIDYLEAKKNKKRSSRPVRAVFEHISNFIDSYF